ncbi:MAG: DNA-3-methyladenine glycosylase family protein [Eubacteriales bacterium]
MAYILEEKILSRAENSTVFGKTEVPRILVGGCGSFSVAKTFECGQAFRFAPVEGKIYAGTAFGRTVAFENAADGVLRVYGSTAEEFDRIWRHYLALDEDYDAIDRFLLGALPDAQGGAVMEAAVEAGRGIRILRQEPFEALISFIVSQNNNIPRIRKIIAALCETYGVNGSFPTAQALADAGEEALFALKTGFRAGYICDAARKVVSGEVNLEEILACDDYDTCAAQLCRIRGVGPKVSACALLYGFGKTEAFPVDVWMKKSLARHFPDGLDVKAFGQYAGIAQQYLFYYERTLGN